jgi:bleomycin hydrolase
MDLVIIGIGFRIRDGKQELRNWSMLRMTVLLLLVWLKLTGTLTTLHQEKGTVQPPAVFRYRIEHNSPLCQGSTSTCWAFSTLSFIESETMRLTGKRYRLSPTWIVYYAYLEKARNFLANAGSARLSNGGLAHDVMLVIQKNGIVPLDDYPGLTPPGIDYDHQKLDDQMKKKLRLQINQKNLVIETALQEIKILLNQYLGTPPTTIEVEQQTFTPQQFVTECLKFNLNEYTQVTSFLYLPFFQNGELRLPDNWQHYQDYFNVPLPVFSDLIQSEMKNGYSFAIYMDLTEKGYDRERSIALLTPYWLASDSVTQETREFFYENGKTTDDHLQHIIGWAPADSTQSYQWFLVKDSLPSSCNSASEGYIYMREDYLKLKVLSFLVHRDILKLQLGASWDQSSKNQTSPTSFK